MEFKNTLAYAREADKNDPLAEYRNQFHIPIHNSEPVVYLTGNSLGLLPKTARAAVEQEFADWERFGVEGHFKAKNPWFSYHKLLTQKTARLVGALQHEVVVMNNLTTNLHLLMVSFYKPDHKRFKIIMEGGAFPSDQYAMESQVRFHGLNPDEAIVELLPRKGEFTLRTEDILETINNHKDELALVMMGGVNYYTGQAFNMAAIAEAAHKAGAFCGFDLAHAAGNLLLQLHQWDVDFAVWCSYKYLNSGPGGTSGVFIHERHANNTQMPRFAGWWGYDEATRFQMKKGFNPTPTAEGWQLSNAQVFPMAIHNASLQLFDKAGMPALRKKSEILTGYLEFVLNEVNASHPEGLFTIITPQTIEDRGCQLSLLVNKNGKTLYNYLESKGVVTDWREPNVIRMAPVPMYNTFEDVFKVGEVIKNFFN